MSFSQDINYLMTNDPSLNEMCNGGIYFENLPDNFNIERTWIVYSFNKSAQESCLGGSVSYTTYDLSLKVVGTDTLEVETINDYLVNYLNDQAYNGIMQINFRFDNHSLDLEKGVYMNTLEFEVYYAK